MRHEFDVGMTCNGCKNAIIKILGKEETLKDVEADVENKKLWVSGEDGSKELVEEKLSKWS